MTTSIAPDMAATFPPPVMEARRWLQEVSLPTDLPLLNVSQAAPVAPPPLGLRTAMAEALEQDATSHLYGPVLGRPDLREALAARVSAHYAGHISVDHVAITSGCNMAFTAAISTLASPGDNVILPLPWYFNHAMWLQMSGIKIRALETGAGLMPDPDQAAAMITERTRAIVLVSPNNPGGAEYPAELIAAFRDLARERNIALILDETYRDFHSQDGSPHDLFTDADWDDTLVHLYSFSKAYRLTGHRVGALVAAPSVLREVEKYLDTVAICAPQPGQIGALWGLKNLNDWLAGERAEILARREAIEHGMSQLLDWELMGAGAYFAYLRHPFNFPSKELAPKILKTAGVLMLPGSFFRPVDHANAGREMRIAFANIDRPQITEMFNRLAALPFSLAPAAQAG